MTLKIILKILTFFSIFFMQLSCKENEIDNNQTLSSSNSNKATNKKNGMVVTYFSDGKIQNILNYLNDSLNGEAISFYSNGFIEKKVVYNKGIINGPYYSFYSSGRIKEYRNWIFGKKGGYGEDYWEKSGDIKTIYFSKNDSLTYEREFDSLGFVIKTSGRMPVLPNR